MELKDYEYFRTDLGVLYKGSSLDIIPLLEKEAVDLILTDPPYELKWKDKIDLKGRKAMLDVDVHWDKVDIVYKVLPCFAEILKESGSLVMFCRSENVSDLIKAEKEVGLDHKCFMVWHKTNPSPQVRKKNFLSSIEAIIWAGKGFHDKIKYTFNFSNQKEMHNFFEGPICMGGERSEHPTQKPMYLMTELVKIFSNEGHTVLDPFAGSGTTALACEKMNRKWIAIELNDKYAEIAKNRIEQEYQQRKLF